MLIKRSYIVGNSQIRPLSVTEQVVAVLEQNILDGVYSSGAKLPPERKLAEEFGVSRPSVRAALQMLVARGMVVSRHGDGHYVSVRLEEGLLNGWQELLERHEYLQNDVLDFRRSLEGVIAGLAAERRTDTDLNRLQFWLDELESAYQSGNIERQSEADVNFHQAVAEAAHNILFAHISGSLLHMLHRHTQQNLANMFGVADVKPQLMSQHRAIFEAIRAQLPHAAAAAAQGHLDFVGSCLTQEREQSHWRQRAEALAAKDLREYKGNGK
ncbi:MULTISPECIES: FadR/GntR family transcriptional regulator [Neisseria]|uniref:FadR/GntR family transcriptional regulator n=1 Tax=Neisseria TaxID=482 RepID=UPI0006493CC5